MIYNKKENCTACGACVNKCPVSAISFVADESGTEYPIIDKEKCIDCNLCKKVCMTWGLPKLRNPIDAKVVALKDQKGLFNSSSGALFMGLAQTVIKDGGVVYGAAYSSEDNNLVVIHKSADCNDDLKNIQGSKYTRSYINLIYKEVEEHLKNGRRVFFTGSPCQVAGLYKYLGQDSELLVTADVICHGVPEQKLFANYLDFLEKEHKGKVIEFSFRSKKYGWGLTGTATVKKKNGKLKKVSVSHLLSSYYSLFIEGSIYRENCYNCKFAQGKRVSDITMGDYWGIYHEHPELLVRNGGPIDETKGLSCAIINTTKGKKLFEDSGELFDSYESSFEKVQRNNGQLNHPSEKTKDYASYFGASNKDYTIIDKIFWDEHSKLKRKTRYCVKRMKVNARSLIKNIKGKSENG